MAKIRCKGTQLLQEIAAVYTAVAQVISLDHSGCESESFDATTLDTTGAYKEYQQTGYSEPGQVGGELYFDPALAGHRSLVSQITTPADKNFRLVFSDATQMTFAGAGFGMGLSVDMGDGLKGSFSIQIDGTPGWPV